MKRLALAALCGVIAPALLVVSARIAVGAGWYGDRRSCDGDLITRLVDEMGVARYTVDILEPNGSITEVSVPVYRLRACARDEHRLRAQDAKAGFEEALGEGVSASRRALWEGLSLYLNRRYDGTSFVKRSIVDYANTGCAGCGGCVAGWQSDGALGAIEEGLSAAWAESGRVHREAERARMEALLHPCEAQLSAAIAAWFAADGPHYRGLVRAAERAVARAARAEGWLLAAPPIAPDPAIDGRVDRAAFAQAAGAGSVAPAVAGRAAADGASFGLDAAAKGLIRRVPPAALVRVGARASNVVVGEVVGSFIAIKVEETLYRGEVAAGLNVAWEQAAEGWRLQSASEYGLGLEAESAEFERWLLGLGGGGELILERR